MKIFGFIFCVLAITACVVSQAHSEDDANAKILKRDFARMMDWLPGRYDNQEQVYFNGNLKVPKEEQHGRLHHIFMPVDLDNIPGTTFYIQQYKNDDPSDIFRQRIYSFAPDFDENAIRQIIYTAKDPKAILDAHEDPSKLEEITTSQFITHKGCDIFWTAQLDHFQGNMKPGACQVKKNPSDKTLNIETNLQLSRSGIWILEEATDSDGHYVYGNKASVPHKNLRAQLFKCWVSPKKENDEYGFYNNVSLHDQGGRVWIEGDGHDRVGLKLRNVVWPIGQNRNSLVLYAYRGEEEDEAISYTWTSPDAKRIALNLRWIQVSCTLGDTQISPGINLKTGSGN